MKTKTRKWFDKVAWSYIPCNVEGFLVLSGLVLAGLAGGWLLSLWEVGLAAKLMQLTWFAVVFATTMRIARNHS